MLKHDTKSSTDKAQSELNDDFQTQPIHSEITTFTDNRPEAVAQRKFQESVDSSQQTAGLEMYQERANNSPQILQTLQFQTLANNNYALNNLPVQRAILDSSLETLGNAFEKDDQVDPQQKAKRDEEIKIRLSTSVADPFKNFLPLGATWDFKHFMLEGEMPPEFGYGIYARLYFGALSTADKVAFMGKANQMRSATVITKVLEQYTPDPELLAAQNQISEDNKIKIGNHLKLKSDANQNVYINDSIDMISEIIRDPLEFFNKIERFAIGGDREKLVAYSDKVWEVVGQAQQQDLFNRADEQGLSFQRAAKVLGRKFLDHGNVLKEKKDDEKTALDHQIIQNMGYVARAWGDSTASLGRDPLGRTITDAYSTTIPAWENGQKEKVQDQLEQTGSYAFGKDNWDDPDKTAEGVGWSDMNIPPSMWSSAANFDRYRDTNVHLYTDKEAQIHKGSQYGIDDHNRLRVTLEELKLGNRWDVKSDGNTAEGGDRKDFLDYTPQNDVNSREDLIKMTGRRHTNMGEDESVNYDGLARPVVKDKKGKHSHVQWQVDRIEEAKKK